MPVTRSQASALARESQVICEISGYEYLLSADYHARFNPYIKPPLTDNTTRTAPSRSFRESTESTEEHPDSLALTLAFSTPPRSGSSTFVIGAGEDADIRLGTDMAMARRMGISRRHLLVEFDDWSQVVVKDVSRRIDGGTVAYEDDHYRHTTTGNPRDPPTWVIPPGRSVTFNYGPLDLVFVVPDHRSHVGQYLQGVQLFRAVQNNPISLIGGLGLGSQTVTTTLGAPALAQEIPLPSTKYGRYAWITGKQLGKGAYGEVVEMFNSTTWTKCAGKKMEHTDFQHEASLLQTLHHPHIAKYIDQEIRHGVANHLVMELCPLKDLGKQHRVQPLSEDEVLEMFAQATSALQYLHEQGVTHRDLKPGNILVRSRQPNPFSIALSDFGLATKDQELMSTFARGTYMFMAPEVVAERIKNRRRVDVKYNNKADIWSMGLVPLELLLEDGLPHPADYGIDIQGDEPDQRYARKMLGVRDEFLARRRGQAFAQLVADMIQWDPADRPSAEECAKRATSVLAASRRPPMEDYPFAQPTTGLLNGRPHDEEAIRTVKRKGKGSSSQRRTRLHPRKPRQTAAAHAGVSKPSTGGPSASDRRAARSLAPSASAGPKTLSSGSLMAELERELANSVYKGPTSGSLMAELDRERLEASDSLQPTGPGDGFVLRGSGPTRTYHDPSPSTRNSAAMPDVEASTIRLIQRDREL